MSVGYKTRRNRYTVASGDLIELTRVFNALARRLDQVEGIALNPDMRGRRVVNVGAAVDDSDAVSKYGIMDSVSAGTGIEISNRAIRISSQGTVADASESHTLTMPADTPATADALRDDLVANVLAEVQTALDALGTTINEIVAALESAGMLEG